MGKVDEMPHAPVVKKMAVKHSLPVPKLAITHLPVGDLKLNPLNPRLHSQKQIRQIAHSIERFGFLAPVEVDGQGLVIAGHGRILAAKLLEMAEVPTVRIEHLTEN